MSRSGASIKLSPEIKHSSHCIINHAPVDDCVGDESCDCGASVIHLHARVAALEAALAAYADPDIYLKRGISLPLDPVIIFDGGDLARRTVPNWEDVDPAHMRLDC